MGSLTELPNLREDESGVFAGGESAVRKARKTPRWAAEKQVFTCWSRARASASCAPGSRHGNWNADKKPCSHQRERGMFGPGLHITALGPVPPDS